MSFKRFSQTDPSNGINTNTIYNLMSYNQDYNEQPVYELDFRYSDDSNSDTAILQNLYRSYLWHTEV